MSKKKGNGYGDWTKLEARLFLSPAWMSLGEKGTAPRVSSCSPQILCLLLGKRQFGWRRDGKGNKVWERTDDNRFTLTYAELQSYGLKRDRITRAIDELLAKGFIEILNPGGLYDKDKAIYALRDDFRGWRRGSPPVRMRNRDVRRGFQGKKLGACSHDDN
ncbi:MAG: hypothetical protein PF495_00375 [Spirochaetales bacterium]|jgi:hypothetical protein|nr:hypothetical protein [Spirochaetales bacterium]